MTVKNVSVVNSWDKRTKENASQTASSGHLVAP